MGKRPAARESHERLDIDMRSTVDLSGPSTNAAQTAERITVAGGPAAGVFGIFATAIGTCLSKNMPHRDVAVTVTSGAEENMRWVKQY